MVSASRQITESYVPCCAAVPRQEKYSYHHPITAHPESHSELSLAVPSLTRFATMDIKSNATAKLWKIKELDFHLCFK
jgi:hypothetical protein